MISQLNSDLSKVWHTDVIQWENDYKTHPQIQISSLLGERGKEDTRETLINRNAKNKEFKFYG